jgi:hypothetical protein
VTVTGSCYLSPAKLHKHVHAVFVVFFKKLPHLLFRIVKTLKTLNTVLAIINKYNKYVLGCHYIIISTQIVYTATWEKFPRIVMTI